jgi:hypothetical protein
MASYTPSGSISVTVSAGSLAVGAGSFAVGDTTLSTSQIPSHNHGVFYWQRGFSGGGAQDYWVQNSAITGTFNSGFTGGGGSHSHGLTGSPSLSGSPSVTAQSFSGSAATLTQNAHNHTASSSFTGNALTLNVKYVNIIICSKN